MADQTSQADRNRRPMAVRLIIILLALLVGAVVFFEVQLGGAGDLESLADGDGTYLVVGSDSRENLPDDLGGNFGDFPGERADVIMLMQVSGDAVQLLSIPRDLRVDIPGEGTNRVNAAYAFGGPDLLVSTVSNATGIPINHYLEVDFGGFAAVVDALGGIELDFPNPARDQKSGLLVEEAGTQVIDGATALAYARSRSYEEQIDGNWQVTSGGDIARTGRQREVLLEILSTVSSPAGVLRAPWVAVNAAPAIDADSTVNSLRLISLAWQFRSASTTEAATLPVVDSTEGGVAYVVRSEPAASEMLEAFAAGSPLPER